MDMTQIAPHVYAALNHNTTSNAGVILASGGAIVVDTLNTPAAGRELAARVTELAGAPAAFVINTHFHPDHTFGNQAFSAPIAGHESLAASLTARFAADYAPGDIATRVALHPGDAWLSDDLRLVCPQIGFIDRLTLDFGRPQVIVRHRGGHTPCMSIVHVPDEGVIFAGDLLFMGRTPYLSGADDIERWIKALRQIEAAAPACIIPGHGEPATLADVTRFRNYIGDLWAIVRKMVGQGKGKEEVVQGKLPHWSDDRPEMQRTNVEFLYDLARV
jgi:cyclase